MRYALHLIRSLFYNYNWPVFLLLAASLAGAIALYGYRANVYLHNNNAGSEYYSSLGQAFLSGHTYLNVFPSPALLALRNPYNPSARNNIPVLWDASLYNGHYYLYFGPIPALLPWIPVKWLTGIRLSDRQLAFFFSSAGTYYLVWLLAAISWRRSAFVRWGTLFSITAICFGTWIPLMLYRPSVYEVAISGAYCFTALGLLSFLYDSFHSTSKSMYWKLLGSLCFGLAAGCRILYGLNVLILLTIYLTAIGSISKWKTRLSDALCLGVPWFLCIAGLGVYNYARFGSVFEIGMKYQLTLSDMHNGLHYLQFSHFQHNFYEYFLKPLPSRPIIPWRPVLDDKPYGLWVNSPFSLWSLWFLANIRRCKSWLGDSYRLAIGVTFFALAITMFMLCFGAVINRYSVDFAPWIMLLAAFGYMHALHTSPKHWQPALLAIGGITAAWGAYIGIVSAAPAWMRPL